MKPLTLLAALAALSSLPAAADTITLPPGLWSWAGTAEMGLAELSDSGQECMRADASTYDLQKVAGSIAPGCALVAAASTGDGVTFSIACKGEVRGALEGTFEFSDSAAALSAKGWTGAPEAPVALSVEATANRTAEDC